MASSQAARNKRKGSQWETDLREGLRSIGADVESLRLAGAEDEGDMVVREARRPRRRKFLVIEAKNAKFEPGVFIKEAQVERENFARHRGLSLDDVDGIAVIKRRGGNWRKAFVLTTVEDYFDLDGAS
ncbi:holliday junction resolvase [Streptomyces phage Yosif]|uniref:Holliday junction resolvase n=1 Tax=Streptomyces phage Yosif TaxID=2201421 RepID=A0A2Z4QC91_9CAUD|nr:holliday junction resolvase [Streptomyces phage Yosif]AWY07603.1 holliday junction resolvase [Streptomyces phage Yosif]